MSIAPGTRLGPYHVLSPLGAGGMGEVWKARDTRLGRDVALKVLRLEVASDVSRLRRFEKEARSASALNHPNIVTVYEIGSAESVSYIAMELVDGKTLREIVADGALPLRRLLQLAPQIADGLARAHEAEIVHRDLKPENLMVTKDGFVKILDFGLAKLSQAVVDGAGSVAATITNDSEPGIVMGTVGYMSPEQAAGKLVDYRSDQFSLGSILYEMATGRRAFHGDSKPETLAAIIREEPEPIETLNPKIPPPLRWVIERCLAKDPKERYASTEDLASDLNHVRDHLSETSALPQTLAISRAVRTPWLVSAAALVAAAALGLFAGKIVWRAPSSSPSFQRLTFRRGLLSNARFGPDGRTILYAASWEGGVVNVYLTQIGSVESRQLLENADLFDVSRSGELAVMIPAGGPRGTLARMAFTGGAPRSLAADIAWGDATWAPDGKDLAIVRTVQGRSRLEYPIGTVLYQSTTPIGSPRFSPAGDRIAFYDSAHGFSVAVLDVSTKQKKSLSTGWAEFRGGMPAWTSDGKEVWFTASEPAQVESLWAVDLSGKRRLVMRVAGVLELFDLSKDRRVLMGHHVVVNGLMCLPPGESSERDLAWLSDSRPGDLSPDGKTLIINEGQDAGGPSGSVYLRKTDGSPAVRLGEGAGVALSPDGNWVIALMSRRGEVSAKLTLLPTGAGETRTLIPGGFEELFRAAWAPDGKTIVFSGSEPGRGPRAYLLEVATGQFRPITPEGVWPRESGGFLSPDGKFLLAARHGEAVLWPLGGTQPVPLRGLSPTDVPVQISADGSSVYVYRSGQAPRGIWSLDPRAGAFRLWKEFRGADPAAQLGPVFVTPSGESYAYQTRRVISTGYVVDGLR